MAEKTQVSSDEQKNKHIYIFDAVLLVGTLIGLMILIGYARPMVIAPIDNLTTSSTSILFSFEQTGVIFIDDNLNFTSPEEINVNENKIINLKPGTYYWKFDNGALKTEIRTLTILSEVNLRLEKSDEGYNVINAGNEKLNVAVYNGTSLVGNTVLDVNDNKEFSNSNKFVGSSNES